jgi:HEAT repeat protein
MEALRTIDRHRGGAQSLVPAIIALLNDPDPSVRYVAASVLTHVDPARAAPALPILSELLFSRAKISGGYIAEVLAFTGLGRLGEPGAKVLISALANADPKIRLNAMDGLTVSDVFPAAAVPALIRLLGDPDELIRHQAMATLAYRRVPAAQVVGPLTALLKDPSENVRYPAIAVLAMLGPGAAQAVPLIKTFTSSTDADVRFTAAAAIVAIQGGTKADVPALLGRFALASAMGSDDPEAAADMRVASLAFIRLGPDAAAAIPALTRAWGRETEPTKTYVGSALAAVDPASAARVFAAMIETAYEDDEYETIEVLYQLAVLGPIAAPVETAVAAFITHAKPRVRDAARAALAAIRIK